MVVPFLPHPAGRSFEPAGWARDFDRAEDVTVPSVSGTFRVYRAGDAGPRLLCVHGGGYTGLTWGPIAARLKSTCQVFAVDLRAHGELPPRIMAGPGGALALRV